MNATTVLLARHGQTAWHSPNRYTGRTDIPLARVGEEQADRLAEWAAGQRLTGLACSAQLRARSTAAPVAARTGLRARVEERLVEVDFGVAEGHTMDEMRERDPDAVAAFLADPAANPWPRGERPAAAVARAYAALAEIAAADPGGRVLVVAHSTLIRLVICSTLGIPLGDYRRRLPRLDPAAVCAISLPAAPATVDGAASGVPGAALLAYNLPVATPSCPQPNHIPTGSR
ncbi:histidine phosphatase family protein [Polymorphospora rubra]|uniref:histidine phosphatase family protein n=1 Tax=Polymorphospora rubra TaxID=338584 RepID=UPI0033D4046C